MCLISIHVICKSYLLYFHGRSSKLDCREMNARDDYLVIIRWDHVAALSMCTFLSLFGYMYSYFVQLFITLILVSCFPRHFVERNSPRPLMFYLNFLKKPPLKNWRKHKMVFHRNGIEKKSCSFFDTQYNRNDVLCAQPTREKKVGWEFLDSFRVAAL